MPEDNGTGEKTEEATPKRKQDARERGQVAKSNELVMVGASLIMFAAIRAFTNMIAVNLQNFVSPFFSGQMLPQGMLTMDNVGSVMMSMILGFLQIIAPILAVAVAAAFIVNIVQTGFLFSTKALEPKMSRINPAEGFKRMFSSRTVFELLKAIIKTIVVALIIYITIRNNLPAFAMMMSDGIQASVLQVANMIFDAAMMILMVLAGVAFMDFMFQRRKHNKDLMMSKYEVKMEMKQQEGDPQVKGRIRQKQRQMAMMRMMQDVPSADVVITNPTHYAVALRYDEEVSSAPVVVAKGKDEIAKKIKEIAAENSVEMVENKPLARSLYVMCEIGDLIPVEMYQVVAEILAEVYKKHQGNF